MRPPIPLAAASALTLALASSACARSSGGDASDAPAPADSIVLERQPCFGLCPVYRVSVAASGVVRFVARDSAGKPYSEGDTIAPAEFTRLLVGAERAAFDSLPTRVSDDQSLCRLRATDHATVVVTIFRPSGVRRVEDYTGCYVESDPPRMAPGLMALRVFESSVDRTAGVSRWVKPVRGKG